MTYVCAWAAPLPVWLVLGDAGSAHREAAEALRQEVDASRPGGIEWISLTPGQLASAPAPRAIVAVGSPAFSAVVNHAKALDSPPPVVATLLPRAAYERILQSAGRRLPATAVVLDQPPARQAAAIRLALRDARRVGMLVGAESRGLLPAYRAALAAAGLELNGGEVSAGGLAATLQEVLTDSDVLLAVPDPAIFNGDTVANILAAGYRRQVPLIGFSPAYVKAGALMGLFVTPAQLGTGASSALFAALRGELPPPQAPGDFTVEANAAVARSLGLTIDAALIRRELRRREGQP